MYNIVNQCFSTFSSVQFSRSVVSDCSWPPWIAARQASLSITNSRSLLKPMSIESVMPSNRLILCHPLLLLPPIPPSIRVFSNESTRHMRWPKYWSFSFSISPSNEHPGLISFSTVYHDKFSCRLSSYKVITILLTIFPVLHITSPCLVLNWVIFPLITEL